MRALKEKIESEKGKDAFPVAGQKLIYAGMNKVLKLTCHFHVYCDILLVLEIAILRIVAYTNRFCQKHCRDKSRD